MKVFHISDLHVRGDRKDNSSLADSLAWISTNMGKDDVLVATGDITDDGKKNQYAHAHELLDPFRGRIFLAPGNHDFGYIGCVYDPAARRRWEAFAKALDRPVELRDGTAVVGRLLALDTCLRTGTPIDFAQGRVGWWALQRVRRFAAACRRAGVASVVALHHNPYYTDWFCRLQDARAFFGTVLGVVDVVLMGHEHKARHTWFPMHLPEDQALTRFWAAGCAGKGDAAVGPICELRADVRGPDGRPAVIPLGAGLATQRTVAAETGGPHGGRRE